MKPPVIYETLWKLGYSPYQLASRISSINGTHLQWFTLGYQKLSSSLKPTTSQFVGGSTQLELVLSQPMILLYKIGVIQKSSINGL